MMRLARSARAGALGLALVMSSVGPEVLVRETTGNEYLGWLAAGTLPCLAGLWLAPKISYRRRDTLVFLTMGPSALPSALIFIRIIWRVAHLPRRDWPLRPDEVVARRHTSHPEPVAADPEPEVPVQPSRPSWSRDVTNV
jgi:hypothetical protein